MSTQAIPAEVAPGKINLRSSIEWVISLLIVFLLSVAVWWLTKIFPTLFTGNANKVLKTIEFPVYAIILGFVVRGILALLRLHERLSAAFRTEFFLKTGVILLGASLNLVNLANPTVVVAQPLYPLPSHSWKKPLAFALLSRLCITWREVIPSRRSIHCYSDEMHTSAHLSDIWSHSHVGTSLRIAHIKR